MNTLTKSLNNKYEQNIYIPKNNYNNIFYDATKTRINFIFKIAQSLGLTFIFEELVKNSLIKKIVSYYLIVFRFILPLLITLLTCGVLFIMIYFVYNNLLYSIFLAIIIVIVYAYYIQ
jgi:hypothetical protein